MFGRKKKPKKTMLRKVEDFNYNLKYPQDRYKDHPNVGRVFIHPTRRQDIIIVAFKDDKTWWYRHTSNKSFTLLDSSIDERKSNKKLSWMEKKGLELDAPRQFGHKMRGDRDRRYF